MVTPDHMQPWKRTRFLSCGCLKAKMWSHYWHLRHFVPLAWPRVPLTAGACSLLGSVLSSAAPLSPLLCAHSSGFLLQSPTSTWAYTRRPLSLLPSYPPLPCAHTVLTSAIVSIPGSNGKYGELFLAQVLMNLQWPMFILVLGCQV